MAAPLRVEERLVSLEARMNAIEQLPGRMDRMELQLMELRGGVAASRNELSARIDDARREMRVLHEDLLGRIAVIGEGLTTLSERVDDQFIQLTGVIDASRTEMRETVAQILTRLDSPRKQKRR